MVANNNIDIDAVIHWTQTGLVESIGQAQQELRRLQQSYRQGTLTSETRGPGGAPQPASRQEFVQRVAGARVRQEDLQRQGQEQIQKIRAQFESQLKELYTSYSQGRLVKHTAGATKPRLATEAEMMARAGELEAGAKRATRGLGRGSQRAIDQARATIDEGLNDYIVKGATARRKAQLTAKKGPIGREVPARQGELFEQVAPKKSAVQKEFDRQRSAQAVRYAASQRMTEDPGAKAMRVGMRQEAAMRRKATAEELAGNSAAAKEYRSSEIDAARWNARIKSMVQGGAMKRLAGDSAYINEQAQLKSSTAKLNAGVLDAASRNTEYLGAQANSARARARETAVVQNVLSGDQQYLAAQKNLARSKTRIAASTAEMLAEDKRYQGYQQTLVRAKAQQSAGLQTALADDKRYLNYQRQAATAKARQAAAVQTGLADDGRYTTAQVQLARAKARQTAAVETSLGGDRTYLEAQTRIAAAKARQAATVQSNLAADNRYLGYQAQLAGAKARQASVVQSTLAGDSEYLANQSVLARAKARQNAVVQETLAGDGQYLASQVSLTRAKAQQNAAVQSSLAADNQYLGAQTQVTSAKARQNAAIQSALASDISYLGAQVSIAKAKSQQAAAVQSTLATDYQYQASQVQLTKAKAQQGAAVQTALAADERYLSMQATIATAKAQQNAAIQGMLASDTEYTTAQANLARAKVAQNARIQEQLASDTLYATNQALVVRGKAQQNAAMQQTLASDELYIAAQAQAARAKAEQSALLSASKAGDELYIAAQANAARSKAEEAAAIAASLAATEEFATLQANAARSKAQSDAIEQEMLATDELYIQATAAAAVSRREGAARQALASAGVKDVTKMAGAEAIAQAQLVKRAQADEERIVMLRALNRQDAASLRLAADRKIEEAKLNSAIRVRERQYMQEAAKSGELGGTRFQRLYARVGIAAGRAPTDYPTLKQFAGQKAFQTLGYGVTGLATGAAFMGVADLLKDASALEQVFVRLRGQLTGIGQGASFDQVRDGIKGIAVETGVAATDITDFASRLIGAYGGDIPRALADTEAATKLAVISGMELKDVFEATMPISQAFGLSMTEIGDMAVEVSDRYGIASENFVKFAGSAAIVSEEAGFSLRELTIASGLMSLKLGKDMQSSADTFNKMPELIRKNKDQIYEILAGDPGSRAYAENFRKQLQENNPGQALIQVLRGVAAVPGAQTGIVKLVANRREAEEATALLSQALPIVSDLDDASVLAGESTGRLNARFASLSDTVTQTFKRIARAVENLGETLYSSGLSEVFVTIGKSVEVLVGLLTGLLSVYKSISEVKLELPGPVDIEKGVLGTWLRYAIIVAGVGKAFQMVAASRAARAGGADAAETKDATARKSVGTASRDAALSIRMETKARQTGIPVAETSALTESGDAARRRTRGATGVGAAGAGAGGLAASQTRGAILLGEGAPQEPKTKLTARQAVNEAVTSRAQAAKARITASRERASAARAEAQAAGKGAVGSSLAGVAAGAPEKLSKAGKALAGASIAADVMMAVQVYSDQRSQVEEQSNLLRDQMKKASTEKLEEISKTESGIVEKIAFGIFGQDLPETLAQATLSAKSAQPGVARMDAITSVKGLAGELLKATNDKNIKVISDALGQSTVLTDAMDEMGLLEHKPILDQIANKFDRSYDRTKPASREAIEKFLPKLKSMAEAGNTEAQVALATYNEVFTGVAKTDAVLAKSIDVAIARHSGDEAIKAAGGGSELIAQKLGVLKQQYENGTITFNDYITQIGEKRKQLRETVETAAAGEQRDKALADLAQFDEEYIKAMQAAFDARVARAQRLTELSGADDAAMKGVQERMRLLPSLERKQQLEEVDKIIDGLKAAFAEELEGIADPVEKAARARAGIKIPAHIRSLELQKAFEADPNLGKTMNDLAQSFGESLADFEKSIADEMVASGKTVEQVVFGRMLAGRKEGEAALRKAAAERVAVEAAAAKALEPPPGLAAGPVQISGGIADASHMFDNVLGPAGSSTAQHKVPKFGPIGPEGPVPPPPQPRSAIAGPMGPEGAIPFTPPAAPAIDMEPLNKEFMSRAEKWFSPQAVQMLASMSGFFQKDTAGMIAWIVETSAKTNDSIEKTTRDEITKRYEEAIKAAKSTDSPGGETVTPEEQRQLDLLQNALDLIPALLGQGSMTAEAERLATETTAKLDHAEAEAQISAEQSKIRLRASQTPRNQLVQAQASVDEALVEQSKLLDLFKRNPGAVSPGELEAAATKVNETTDALKQHQEDIANVALMWAAQRAGNDPVAKTNAQLNMARKALATSIANNEDPYQIAQAGIAVDELERQTVQNAQDIAMATLEYQQAQVAENPVEAARKAVQMADLAYANAEGDAAKKRAAIQQLQSQRDLAKSLSDLVASEAELAIAIAEAASDPVRAAEIAVGEAQRNLNEAQARVHGDAEINQLTGALVTANRNLFMTSLNRQKEAIEFMREMGQITLSQAISEYENMLGTTREGSDEWKDLMLTIKRLKDEASGGGAGGLQFNLPTSLGLPTFYESRRMAQSMMQGIGYQDNRQVTMNVAINGAQDPAMVADQLQVVFNATLSPGSAPAMTASARTGAYR